MKSRFMVLILLLFISSLAFPQNVVTQVKIDTLKRYLRELSGDTSFVLNLNRYTISTRNTISQSSNYLAALYIKLRLQSYGLTVTEQPFSFNGYDAKNVYAVQTGSTYPTSKYIICAHYDAITHGADDNGSGTCAVLEAARIISKLSPKYTIVYALWSGEEQGLKGSDYYAQLARANNEDIVGVINMDMIGWDGDKNNDLAIYDAFTSNQFITDILSSVNTNFNIGLILSKYSTPETRSDNYSFSLRGYPEICMIENDYASSIYYHDRVLPDIYTYISLNFMRNVQSLLSALWLNSREL